MNSSYFPIVALKHLVKRKITDGPHVTPEFLNEGVPFLSVDSIQDSRLVFENCRRISTAAHRDYSRKCKPGRGDLLIAKAASTGKVAMVDVDFEFSVWSPLALISPNLRQIYSRFLFYALVSPEVQARIDLLCTFNTQRNISMGDLEQLQVPVPSLSRQRAIADFLDHEIARIDELIRRKREFVEQLEIKRSAVIAAAFLGPAESEIRKDTALGTLPNSWSVKRLKFLTEQITVGIVVTPSKYYVDDGIPCLRSFNIKPMRVSAHDLVYISAESNELHRKSKIHGGDVVVVRTGQPGTAAVVPDELHNTNCIDLIIIRRPAMNSELLAYFLNSAMAKSQFVAGTNGAIQQHFNIEQAKNVLVPVPPSGRQQELVQRLRTFNNGLDALIAKLETGIAALLEYRASLISAAVTGQIDTRTYRPQEAVVLCQ